jgi:F0F1-type ATP synthase membrane subunit b/b'
MNNLQLYIVVGLPTLTILVGMFLNQRAFDRLENSLGGRMDRLEARLDRIEADLREFYRTLGQHEARLDNLERRSA